METKSNKMQLVNVIHLRGDYKAKRSDKIIVVDKVGGEKRFSVVESPKLDFYITKEELRDQLADPPPLFVTPDQVDKVSVPYGDLFKFIADELGYQDYMNDCFRNRQIGMLRRLHLCPELHGSDVDIADHYIGKYLDKYEARLDPGATMTKGYWDTEVDSIEIDGFPEPEEALCPVNMLTYIDDTGDKPLMYTLLLRNENNPQIAEFEENMDAFLRRTSERFEMDVQITMFDEELDLLKYFFHLINNVHRPDAVMAWNQAFDVVTVMNRIIRLGGDVNEIMCPEEFPYKRVYFREDKFAKDPSEKRDYMDITGYTVFLDSMIVYAEIRKSMQKKDSYALDDILFDEVGETKDEIQGKSIKTFPYENYEKAVEYNMQDVAGLRKLELKNADIDLIYAISQMTRTRMNKAMVKTTCLRNMAEKFFADQGKILSNNRNQSYGVDDGGSAEKFKGAFVGDPTLLEPTGIQIGGKKSARVFERVCDLDLASLYPSIILTLNIDTTTQFGKLILPDENGEGDLSEQFMDHWTSRDYVTIGSKWFGLPDAEELFKMFSD